MKFTVFLASAAAWTAAAGCGGDDDEREPANLRPPAITEAASLNEPPPKGSSLLLKEIYRQFQPPEPDPGVKGSAKAIKRGEETCKGKTPTEVTEEFIAESDLTDDQEKAVAELDKFERNPSASFPAGQVAALVYQNTISDEILSSYGFQGCVYSLSLGVKKQLAPKGAQSR